MMHKCIAWCYSFVLCTFARYDNLHLTWSARHLFAYFSIMYGFILFFCEPYCAVNSAKYGFFSVVFATWCDIMCMYLFDFVKWGNARRNGSNERWRNREWHVHLLVQGCLSLCDFFVWSSLSEVRWVRCEPGVTAGCQALHQAPCKMAGKDAEDVNLYVLRHDAENSNLSATTSMKLDVHHFAPALYLLRCYGWLLTQDSSGSTDPWRRSHSLWPAWNQCLLSMDGPACRSSWLKAELSVALAHPRPLIISRCGSGRWWTWTRTYT